MEKDYTCSCCGATITLFRVKAFDMPTIKCPLCRENAAQNIAAVGFANATAVARERENPGQAYVTKAG